LRPEGEQRVLADGGNRPQVLGNGRPVGECVDGGEAILERRDAQFVELLVVHARGPEIADDLVDAGGIGFGGDVFGQC
jgi:hypothetical protein